MRAIDKRTYRYKKPHLSFFCPLCSSSRAIVQNHKMEKQHHFQVAILTALSALILFPLCGYKSLFLYFFYWAIFELARKLIFKKDLPCPHCGFDASWYKKDVKVARAKVKEFWEQTKVPDSKPNSPADSASQ